jgi:hypothetical protein
VGLELEIAQAYFEQSRVLQTDPAKYEKTNEEYEDSREVLVENNPEEDAVVWMKISVLVQ